MNTRVHTMKTLIRGLALVMLLAGTAQAQRLSVRLADKSFSEFSFIEAIKLYEAAFERDTTDNYVVKQLAESNRNVGNTEEVEKWLGKLIRRGAYEPEDIFHYSQSLKSNGKYLEAEQWLKQYSELRPEDGRVNLQVSLLEYIQFLHRDSTRYEVKNAGINTPGSEMGPAYYKDQLILSSTSLGGQSSRRKYNWNNLPYLDMYVANIQADGRLSNPRPFAPKLKTSYHDGPVSYDRANNKLYFTRNNVVKRRAQKSEEGEVNLKIFTAVERNGEWVFSGDFRYNSDEYSVGHPSIDKTGTILYFASDMPGGYGGSDIYFSILTDGRWSEPFNLGPKINTEGNEFFPFISDEGVLYFASDGHGGLGGLDIYFSVPERGVFNSIENMGYPVNSPKDDFGLVLDESGMKGYFASNRAESVGNDDIFFLNILRIPVIIRGVVKDRETEEILADAAISLVDEAGDTLATVITRNDGQFEFEVAKGLDYVLNGRKEYYHENEKEVTTKSMLPNDELFVELFLEIEFEDDGYPEPMTMDVEDGEPIQIIELEYIHYGLDKWQVNDRGGAAVLDRLIAILQEYPDLEIRLESHTDSQGSDEYNMRLSERRATAAYDYLKSKGVDPSRIQYEGFGETQLLNRCVNGVVCSDEEHEVNRRTIVKVIRKGEYRSRRGQRSIFYF